jgi:hypothetical protein
MKTIKKVTITPQYVDTIPDFGTMEQDVLYISLQHKTALHLCLCGCGQETVTPLNETHGWLLINNADNKISLTPSIGNYQFECKSHYIITNNVANFV